MQLNYKQIGQGPNVILIHGLFGSLENLNVIAKPLMLIYVIMAFRPTAMKWIILKWLMMLLN